MVRGVDPDELDPEAPERVERDVEGEQAPAAAGGSAARRRRRGRRPPQEVPERSRRGTRGGRSPGRSLRAAGGRGRSRGPRAGRSAFRRAPGSTSCRSDPPPVRRAGPGARQSASKPDVGACALRDEAADETAGGDPAPDAEAALPDRERPPPLVGHLVPARREVVQPRTDDARADAPDGAAEDEVPVTAAVDESMTGDPDADADRGEQRQPVHVDRERAEVDGAARRARGSRRERLMVPGGRSHECRIPRRRSGRLLSERVTPGLRPGVRCAGGRASRL